MRRKRGGLLSANLLMFLADTEQKCVIFGAESCSANREENAAPQFRKRFSTNLKLTFMTGAMCYRFEHKQVVAVPDKNVG